eukprot:Lithocolla_globosa_v1_NODE_309_length_4559_cov_14.810169.p3 type:complete len:133 gc:universal NODE_309_length_4559_cov_14.810169:4397-3999(-)
MSLPSSFFFFSNPTSTLVVCFVVCSINRCVPSVKMVAFAFLNVELTLAWNLLVVGVRACGRRQFAATCSAKVEISLLVSAAIPPYTSNISAMNSAPAASASALYFFFFALAAVLTVARALRDAAGRWLSVSG